MKTDLFQRSIEIILENQTTSGAYLASPNFANYRFSWFRDGAYIAYAMDLVGEYASASRFHNWAAQVINQNADLIHNVATRENLTQPDRTEILHTRYSTDGRVSNDDWPNFQLDGFGTWLWSLDAHQRLSSEQLADSIRSAAHLTSEYLASLWHLSCYDCWEEFPTHLHVYTLGSIYAGLEAEDRINGGSSVVRLKEISERIEAEASRLGYFPKFFGGEQVDASLIGLSVPYDLFEPGHPLVIETVKKIVATLCIGGGVHRYDTDTYYGGGEWILLTAWLGWYYSMLGDSEKARSLKTWVEAQADERGYLPEQVPESLNDPSQYEPWRSRWGEIARPLLWSHAKYLILCKSLESWN
jgi:GH15 family glucan-1,4-alpha-glucosidase